MDDLKRTIGARLREARQHAGLTQAELADLAGIKGKTYSNYERGDNWIPVENLVRIKQVVDKPINYFFAMGDDKLSDDEIFLLGIYRSLPDWLKKLAIEFLQILQKNKRE